MNSKLAKTLTLALALTLAVAAFGHEAQAARTVGCVVNTVGYDNQRLMVWCASNVYVVYYAFGSTWTDCNAIGYTSSIDTLKIWQSMLQAAALSGRKVDIDWRTNASCQGGSRSITSLQLQRQ